MKVKTLTQIALLSTLAVVLRFAFVEFPNIKPITALFFVIVVFMGLSESLMVMALTMTITAIQLGMSPVVIFQIVSFGIILVLWSIIYRKLPNIYVQMLVIFILTMFYGIFISLCSSLMYNINFYIYYVNGLYFDLMHAISTVIFYPIIYKIFERLKL